jgi:hypothetical protein
MEKCPVNRNQAIPANNQTPEVTQPSKGSLDFPPPAIAPQFSTILQLGLFPITPMRADQLNLLDLQPLSQRITVVGLVSDQPPHTLARPAPRPARHLHLLKGLFDQSDFRRRGPSKCASKRNTLAVDHHHPLRTLAALGFSDTGPPFFAGAKLPSAKVSSQSRYWRSSSSARSARQTSSQMFNSSQSFSRRQQVEALGYRLGRSRQRAPLLSTQRMPSKTCRLSCQGLPPLGPAAVLGKSGSSFFHCSSFRNGVVRAIGLPPTAYYPKSFKKSSGLTC